MRSRWLNVELWAKKVLHVLSCNTRLLSLSSSLHSIICVQILVFVHMRFSLCFTEKNSKKTSCLFSAWWATKTWGLMSQFRLFALSFLSHTHTCCIALWMLQKITRILLTWCCLWALPQKTVICPLAHTWWPSSRHQWWSLTWWLKLQKCLWN